MKALRQKKNVQETLLKDAVRKWFHSFLDELRLDPADAAGDFAFDAKEMWARKMIGLSPELKPTHKRITKLCPNVKYLIDGEALTKEEELSDAPRSRQEIYAAQYLMTKFDESGVLLKPNVKESPEYATSDEYEQEVS